MPLNLPTFSIIIDRIRSDVRKLLPSLDPTIFGSKIRTLTDSNAGRHFDNVRSIKQLEKEAFPFDASLEQLERWAAYDGIIPFSSKQSTGNMLFTGTVGGIILADTDLKSVNEDVYITDESGTISNVSISVTLSRSGTTVTAVASSAIIFATNIDVTIAGAVETEYNGTFTITVLSTLSFSYEITGTPSTPATGTILADSDCVSVQVTSEDFGLDQNLDSGAELTLVSSITDVDRTGFVRFEGLIGAQDAESADSLLNRTQQVRANPVANFNIAAITKAALAIQGVTRLLVKRITPRIGAVTVLFVRDGDDLIIPNATQIAEVKAAIVELLPATSEEDDVVVLAPTPVPTTYNFSSITPDTATMRTAITNNLNAFYEDEVTFETDVTEKKYEFAITGTIDPDTGQTLTDFTLSVPSGNITVTTNELGTIQEIIFQ